MKKTLRNVLIFLAVLFCCFPVAILSLERIISPSPAAQTQSPQIGVRDTPRPPATASPASDRKATPQDAPSVPASTETPAPTETPPPTPTADTRSTMQRAAEEMCEANLMSVDAVARTDGGTTTTIDCRFNDLLFDSITYGNVARQLHKLSEAAATDQTVKILQFRITAELKDQYGNTSDGQVFNFVVPRELLAKVNFSALNPKEFARLVARRDSGARAVVAPAVRDKWNEYLGE